MVLLRFIEVECDIAQFCHLIAYLNFFVVVFSFLIVTLKQQQQLLLTELNKNRNWYTTRHEFIVC